MSDNDVSTPKFSVGDHVCTDQSELSGWAPATIDEVYSDGSYRAITDSGVPFKLALDWEQYYYTCEGDIDDNVDNGDGDDNVDNGDGDDNVDNGGGNEGNESGNDEGDQSGDNDGEEEPVQQYEKDKNMTYLILAIAAALLALLFRG